MVNKVGKIRWNRNFGRVVESMNELAIFCCVLSDLLELSDLELIDDRSLWRGCSGCVILICYLTD